MSKAKKSGGASKKKFGSSPPILIHFDKTKFGSANKNSFKDHEKREEVKFPVGSYNPDKNYNFIQEALKEEKSNKTNDIDLVGKDNTINNPIYDEMIFGDLEL